MRDNFHADKETLGKIVHPTQLSKRNSITRDAEPFWQFYFIILTSPFTKR